VLAEIKSASSNRIEIAEALHIYRNDLVGIDQFGREHGGVSEVPLREISPAETGEWTDFVGHIWRVPEDGRLSLRFQKRWLLRPLQGIMRVLSDPLPAPLYLQQLAADETLIPIQEGLGFPFELASSSISIYDYFDRDMGIQYDIEQKPTMPFEAPPFMDQSEPKSTNVPAICSSGPWRRIVYAYVPSL